MNHDTAEDAWKEVREAAHHASLKTGSTAESCGSPGDAVALAAAKRAEEFCARFPDSANVTAARKLQCEMLETAFFSGYDTRVFRSWALAQQTLLADPTLAAEDRFTVRLAVLNREIYDRELDGDARQARRENDVRALMRDYPGKDRPREMLLNLAANSGEEKARAMVGEILELSLSADLKAKAEGILRRLDAVGKPLDIRFTALDGRKVDLGQWQGKVVLVDFWAAWCGPCVDEIPRVKEVYQRWHSQGFEVAGISLDSSREKLARVVQKSEIPWPEYFDGKGWLNQFAIKYGIAAIPALWLVDKTGKLRDVDARRDLADKVGKLMAE